jgi:hypothetical protein
MNNIRDARSKRDRLTEMSNGYSTMLSHKEVLQALRSGLQSTHTYRPNSEEAEADDYVKQEPNVEEHISDAPQPPVFPVPNAERRTDVQQDAGTKGRKGRKCTEEQKEHISSSVHTKKRQKLPGLADKGDSKWQ